MAANVLENRGLTSTRNGIRKAEAAIRYAEILGEHEIQTLGDVAMLLVDQPRLDAVEHELRAVRGNGAHDVRLNYLWMLAGDDHRVKPDRRVLRQSGRT